MDKRYNLLDKQRIVLDLSRNEPRCTRSIPVFYRNADAHSGFAGLGIEGDSDFIHDACVGCYPWCIFFQYIFVRIIKIVIPVEINPHIPIDDRIWEAWYAVAGQRDRVLFSYLDVGREIGIVGISEVVPGYFGQVSQPGPGDPKGGVPGRVSIRVVAARQLDLQGF